jgi:hypothetical protein
MTHSTEINELAKALSAFQGEMHTVKMDANNPFFKSKYASLNNLVDASKTVLAKNGLAVSQHPDGRYGLTSILLHSSGQWLSSTMSFPEELEVQRGMSFAQFAGSVISYQRRYAYASILGLVSDEDVDGNTPNQTQGKQPTQTVPPITPETLKRLNTIGSNFYDNNWDAKRPTLVSSITKGRTESSKELTEDEANRIIAGLEKKIESLEAEERQKNA